jgi:hypothetical protein
VVLKSEMLLRGGAVAGSADKRLDDMTMEKNSDIDTFPAFHFGEWTMKDLMNGAMDGVKWMVCRYCMLLCLDLEKTASQGTK